MSSRFDRRSGKSSPGGPSRGGSARGGPSRGARPGGGRRDGDGSSGRSAYSSRSSGSGSSSGRSAGQRSVYRLRREQDASDGSAGTFDPRRSEQGSDRRDRRDRPRSEQGPPANRQRNRQFRDNRPSRRSGDERFGQRPSWGRSSPTSDRQPPLSRTESSSSARAPEAETFGPAPADDLLWGRHTTQAALEAGRPIHRIWCTSDLRSAPKFLRLLREAKSSGVLVEEVSWARLGQLTGGAVHQGIVLQTAAAETLDLQSLIEGCAALEEPPLLLALDGLTDPHNLGAIVRSAEALGAHGVVLPQRRSAGLTGSVAKVAAGALEHLPVARVVNLNRSLEALKQVGYRVIGLADEGDITLSDVDLDGPLVVVTGSEDQGLSLLTRRHCDQLVRIPLRGVTPSLNASVATAMCLYEVARRGWMKSVHGQAPSPRIVRPQCPLQEAADDKDPIESELIAKTSDSSNSLPDVFALSGEALPTTLTDQEGCLEDVQPARDDQTEELPVDLTPMGDEDSLTNQS
ncbi:MAG TPA: 23S rRNA (guanosine(2251)-2'-O)-methyltransferase RlmB [Prochlorococcaceae cyanobacterium Fu_MAG_134]|nr:23S rRNA (guanosine(2251)-2'-O)-methyltransferase RlmB [Prochlorococcaceae cyanobacterium Fu_MAG_134]